jgi:hypothetical protein
MQKVNGENASDLSASYISMNNQINVMGTPALGKKQQGYGRPGV